MALIRIQQCSEQKDAFHAKISFNEGPPYDVTVYDPFTKEEEERLEWYFEEHLKFPFIDQVKAQEAATSITEYGEKLFEQVFTADSQIFSTYKTTIKAGLDEVQIEIVGEPLFQAFHWEALKDPEISRPLALQATFMRKNLSHQAAYADVRSSPTINLLIVTARLRGKQDIGYRTISRPLVESLRQDRLPVKIDILRPGTYKALEHHLLATTGQYGVGYYHVIHFDVHGAVLPYPLIRHLLHTRYGRDKLQPYAGMKAFLFLEEEKDNRADPLEATELAQLLIAHQIPIAILNACQSGRQVGEHETSLGSRLMQAGIQMVIAMGYSVTVTAAELLMKTLYQQLFDGRELSTAVRVARCELYKRKGRQAYYNQTIDLEDWLLPVVYQNQPQGLTPRPFTPQEEAHFWGKEAERYQSTSPTYGFVGRDLDILHIEKLLLTRSNLLLIQGMGGAGKTTLLQHIAEWWQRTGFVEQVFYFSYNEKTWTCQQILVDLAHQFLSEVEYMRDFQPRPLDEQQAILVKRLRAEPHLLILDNLESITGFHLDTQYPLSSKDQRALQHLLSNLIGGRTLVLLGSRGDEAWLARGTFEDNVYELQGLDPEASSILVDRILERHHVTTYRQDEGIRKLLKLLDGFPLALEVVLANLSHQSPTEILSAFQAGDVKLDSNNSQEKTESIQRCIDYSYGNLSSEAQTLLLCLAPFTSVIYLPALQYYTTLLQQQSVMPILPFEHWPKVIRETKNWGLLTALPNNESFLHLHPVLPYFLRNRLYGSEQTDMHQAVERAFYQLYAQIGTEMLLLLLSDELQKRKEGQAVVNLEYENLVSALQFALEAQLSFRKIYSALSAYHNVKYDGHGGLELSQAVLCHRTGYSTDMLNGPLGLEFVIVIANLARFQIQLKRYAEAQTSCQDALHWVLLAEHIDEEERNEVKSAIYELLGLASQHLHLYDQAEEYYLLPSKFSDSTGRDASTYFQLGSLAQERRLWTQAEKNYELALQIAINQKDYALQARIYHNFGLIAQQQRLWTQAEKKYHLALEIKIALNDRYEQALTYQQLGRVAKEQRHWEQAAQYFQQALRLFIDLNDRYQQAVSYNNLGTVAQGGDHWEQAEQYFQKALRLYEEFGDHHEQAKIALNLGTIDYQRHHWEQAEQYFQKALRLYEELNDLHQQAETYLSLGILAQDQRQQKQAERYYEKALQCSKKFNDSYQHARIYRQQGTIAKERAQWNRAHDLLQQALEIFASQNDWHFLDQVIYDLLSLWQENYDNKILITIASTMQKHNIAENCQDTQLLQRLNALKDVLLPMFLLAGLPEEMLSRVFQALQTNHNSNIDDDDSQSEVERIVRSIDYSYRNLTLETQALLMCLAPFDQVIYLPLLDGFERYSTHLLQQPSLASLPFTSWSQVIQEAKDWGLLYPHADFPDALRLQPILLAFLRQRLYAPEEREMRHAVEIAFRDLYDQIGESLYELLTSNRSDEHRLGLILTRVEFGNLMVALNLALAAQIPILKLYGALDTYLEISQDHQFGLELGQRVLSQLEAYPTELLAGPMHFEFACVVNGIGQRQIMLKQYSEAEESFQRGLSICLEKTTYQVESLRRLTASTYHNLGLVAQQRRQWKEAKRHYQHALQIYDEERDRDRYVRIYYMLGTLAQLRRQWKQAQQYYHSALKIYSEFNEPLEEANVYHQLGTLAQERRQWEQAEQHYQLALRIYSEFNDFFHLAGTFYQLGSLAQEKHQWEQAEQCYQRALQAYDKLDEQPYDRAMTCYQLGVLAQEQHQWKQAESYYQQALKIYKKFDESFEEANVYHCLGIIAHECQQWTKAGEHLLHALKIYVTLKDEQGKYQVLHTLATLWQASGNENLLSLIGSVVDAAQDKVEELLREIISKGSREEDY